ncbi:MAG: mechanosensitive ion channel [Candidatus Bathyarchaeota archaeon]|nr:MAG: mechanosensitive ion channel [Candidatus Bathyarchaeota archaeon]
MLEEFLNFLHDWVSSSWRAIVFSIISIFIVYTSYRLLTRQLIRLKEKGKISEDANRTLKRIFQWITGLILLGIIIAQLGIDVGIIAGLLVLAGGTIIGFASQNTIGNAIAGIIIMISRPFKIGDRIYFNDKFADVIDIDLIFTRMKTLDNVMVSVPNQQLITSEINNYGKKTIIRRSCSITAGYEIPTEQVEKALLEAAKKMDEVLQNPQAYVWITNFGDFAIEYTLYVFINQIKRLLEIDAQLKKTVLLTVRQHGIDISTPRLIQRVSDSDSNLIDG